MTFLRQSMLNLYCVLSTCFLLHRTARCNADVAFNAVHNLQVWPGHLTMNVGAMLFFLMIQTHTHSQCGRMRSIGLRRPH